MTIFDSDDCLIKQFYHKNDTGLNFLTLQSVVIIFIVTSDYIMMYWCVLFFT